MRWHLVGLALILTGCGNSAPATIEEAVQLAGCEVVKYDTATANAFNTRAAKCTGDARVYWFPTAEAQANHGEMCKQVGGLKVAAGKNWTKYSPSC